MITIADREFELVKKGRPQAEQLHQLGSWLAKYGADALGMLDSLPAEGAGVADTVSFLGGIFANLPADAMLNLYKLVLDCDDEFADENFDIVDLIDAAIAVYNEQSAVRRLVDRFFSIASSNVTSEDGVTTSDEPTDGEMTISSTTSSDTE